MYAEDVIGSNTGSQIQNTETYAWYLDKWFSSDDKFNQLYPVPVQLLAKRHWTPLAVARKAAEFLAAEPGSKILDIGSGVGKFCISASYYKPKAWYYGIEQRNSLIEHAEYARDKLRLKNASFIHGNFTQLDLRDYDHFYFFNSFYENLAGTDRIDESIDYSAELFSYYTRYLYKQLEQTPAGTRLATYHSMEEEVPPGFYVAGTEMDNLLKFWIKI